MTRNSKFAAAALAATLSLGVLAGAIGPSIAQVAPTTTTEQGVAQKGRGHGHMHRAHFQGQRADRIDGRIAFLKAELKITPAQQGAWDGFEKVLRQQAADRKAAGEKMRAEWQAKRAAFKQQADDAKAKGTTAPTPTRPSAIERMERQQAFMKARIDSQSKVLDALKPLYASFSPEQKQTADQLLGGFHGRGHGHGGPGHGRF